MVVQPSPDDQQLDRLFRALADSTRRDVLRRTMTSEPSVSELASAYNMSFAAVQKHIAVLEAAGLVDKTALGRERHVRANLAQLARAKAALSALEALWAHRINALDDLFSEPKE